MKGNFKPIEGKKGHFGKLYIRGLCNICGKKLSEFEINNLDNYCYDCDKKRQRGEINHE